MEIKVGKGIIRGGRTEIEVPHKKGSLTFSYPLIGPGEYQDVMRGIDYQELIRPTTEELISLVDFAYKNRDEFHCAKIRAAMENSCLWTCTENLYIPNKPEFSEKVRGKVLVYDNLDGWIERYSIRGIFSYTNIHGEYIPLKEEELIKLAESDDERIKISKGESTYFGYGTTYDFFSDSHKIAQMGNEMDSTLRSVIHQVYSRPCWIINREVVMRGIFCPSEVIRGFTTFHVVKGSEDFGNYSKKNFGIDMCSNGNDREGFSAGIIKKN